ncbi:MAG: riboflavin synthase [Oscillatoriales cyanobacterium SM2_2_1]|nr:riboflavin synthase [Oscillatoriales cyanobacterium SM2_2_1]
MFTGLIQAVGQIRAIAPTQINIACPDLRPELKLGDSIAVNGICLTAAELWSDGFVADLSPETLSRTNLGVRHQRAVNLELALKLGDRLGGHLVSGHVDAIGHLSQQHFRDQAWELTFTVPPSIQRYLVEKGSIAANGVSLTIAWQQEDHFGVAMIPHTYIHTNFASLTHGAVINLEIDQVAKYVEKLLSPIAPTSCSPGFLREHGYLS